MPGEQNSQVLAALKQDSCLYTWRQPCKMSVILFWLPNTKYWTCIWTNARLGQEDKARLSCPNWCGSCHHIMLNQTETEFSAWFWLHPSLSIKPPTHKTAISTDPTVDPSPYIQKPPHHLTQMQTKVKESTSSESLPHNKKTQQKTKKLHTHKKNSKQTNKSQRNNTHALRTWRKALGYLLISNLLLLRLNMD